MATVWCDAGPLEQFIVRVCEEFGTPEDIATEVGQHLVRANLSGHDSHGVLRLEWYVEQIAAGELIPDARPTIVNEAPAAAVFDAGYGFGHYSTRVALDWALERARKQGVAVATTRNFTHIGRLGEYAERGAAQGMVTLVTIGTAGPGNGIMAPFGGRERFLGTNPWAIGIPAARRSPMVYDAATSVRAEGKVRVTRAKAQTLPSGVVLDRDGMPSVEPEDLYAGGMLLPVGGSVAGHKGYGFAMAAALLGGLALGTTHPEGSIQGVLAMAFDPGAFGNREDYLEQTAAVMEAVTQVSPLPGVERVLVPGEPEIRTRAERSQNGIPLPQAIWNALVKLAARAHIDPPDHRPGQE